MFSLAGKRPGARRFASPGKHDRAQPGYLKPLHRSYKIDPLGPDAIKPLVALAYTSKSVEVRRDAAAALCTLACLPAETLRLAKVEAEVAASPLAISESRLDREKAAKFLKSVRLA